MFEFIKNVLEIGENECRQISKCQKPIPIHSAAVPDHGEEEEKGERATRRDDNYSSVEMKLDIRNTGNIKREVGLWFLETGVCSVTLLLHHGKTLPLTGRDCGHLLQGLAVSLLSAMLPKSFGVR